MVLRIFVGVWRRVALLFVLLVTAVLPLWPSGAQIASGGKIDEIRIEGTQRVEPDTVKSYLLVQPGDEFDGEKLDGSLKALFATGLFSDVTLRREGNSLIVRVVENPVINRIAFEGNHKLSDDTLNSEIQLKPRIVYTRQKVQSDVVRILELYRQSGRFAATVQPKVVQLSQNRVDLVFEIDEGPSTGVRSITFLGNHIFSAAKLREIISTRESRWYRFLSTADTYDPDRLTYDRELLRKFYLSEGYADFRVVTAVAELAPSRDGFLITFTVEEGERYKFGKVELTNQLKDVDPALLRSLLTTKSGDWYNADQIDRSITRISDTLGDRGYAFVVVTPTVHRNPDTRTIDVGYDVKEGPRVYVERIDITGNLRTLDKVIRREFRLVEGDAFSTAKLNRSQQRIKNLGFFKKVDITHTPGSAPDKTIVRADVQEQSTGEFSVGIGFSTADGPLANIGIRERNLLGKGQDLRIDGLIAYRTQQVDLGFTEPYFLNRNLAAGFDLFGSRRDNQYFAGYNQQSLGGTLRLGYQITDFLRQTLTYTLRTDYIYNIASNASVFVQDQFGTRNTSSVGQSLLYDRRDNRLNPTSGYYIGEGNDFAGLGGNVNYLRSSINGGVYYPVAPQWVASLTGEAGTIMGLGEGVRIEDRYYVGSDNLRGFAVGGIGPRDSTTNQALGGDNYFAGAVQLGMPLGLPQEFGLTGHVFSDFGSLWGINEAGPTLEGQGGPTMRVTFGYGLSWDSPLGPIKLDLALPILRKDYDKKQIFHVNFGAKF